MVFISEKELHIYLTEGELPPRRTCKHKNHLMKVMFLSAVTRPRFDDEGNCIFDGKIGIWPFIQKVQAKRNSKNRCKGTWVTEPVKVNKKLYTQFMCKKVALAIKRKFKKYAPNVRKVGVQHDNAKAHFRGNIDDLPLIWLHHCISDPDLELELSEQPPNSPDLNILDLAFFRALQSHQWRMGFENTIDGLIQQVKKAYWSYDPEKLDHSFVTLQTVLQMTLETKGDNVFEIPHMNKEQLRREDNLPTNIEVSEVALEVIKQYKEGTLTIIDPSAE